MDRSPLSYVLKLAILTLLQLFIYMNSSCSAAMRPFQIKTNQEYNNMFIKTSCSVTNYPSLCYKSLLRHASKIQADPQLLAHAALNRTVTAAKYASIMLGQMSRIHGLNPKESAAVLDCVADIHDSIEELKDSMRGLDNANDDSDFQLQIHDIQMWVNAALEDEDTCLDTFSGKAMDGKVKSTVRGRIVKVAHLTSNALALINSYAVAMANSS